MHRGGQHVVLWVACLDVELGGTEERGDLGDLFWVETVVDFDAENPHLVEVFFQRHILGVRQDLDQLLWRAWFRSIVIAVFCHDGYDHARVEDPCNG